MSRWRIQGADEVHRPKMPALVRVLIIRSSPTSRQLPTASNVARRSPSTPTIRSSSQTSSGRPETASTCQGGHPRPTTCPTT